MNTKEKQELTMKAIVDQEQIKKAKEIILSLRKRAKEFVANKRNDQRLLISCAIILLCIAIYRGISLYQTINTLNSNPYTLEKIQQYDLLTLKANPLTRNIVSSSANIYDLIQNNEDIKNETERYNKYKTNLQLPYTYFLQYILLPKLNIRKEPYTDVLKTNILGETYLEENPYNDVNLLQKRTDFFSSTNQNEINQIKEIEIGDIKEYENGLFGIKIQFGFTAPSKNALLFLTDKITATSDQENISLLGEFFYYLRQQIKLDKKEKITELEKNSIFSGENNIDKIIGYNLHNRITKDESNDLVDDVTINRTIFSMMGCSPDAQAQCFYKFREKYRNLAGLAYTVGVMDNKNKTEDLKDIIKKMTPIIAVQEFVYNKIQEASLIKQNTTKFEGKIGLEIYGQSISPEDREELANALGKKCFGEEKTLSPQEGLAVIDEAIRKKSNVIDENQNKSTSIRDLKTTIENINTDFETLSNYKKTIRLFEIYRMLNENGLCKTI